MADKFEYKEYQESDAVRQAQEALQNQLAQKPGAYQSQWQTSLNDTLDKIMNRQEFKYDLNGDALYQQYKDRYVQQGQMAMKDTMGQAAALTGGYGNSYAQNVGQQAYHGYLQGLNDKVPELYQLALDKYNQDTSNLYNQYSLLGQREDMDYGRYRDSLADWNAERDFLTGRYDSERSYDYGKYADDRDFGYGQYRDAIADEQWQKNFDEALRQFNYANKLISADEAMGRPSSAGSSGASGGSGGGGGSSSGGSGYNNGGLSSGQIAEMQAYYGTTADGKWGANSTAAADGMSAQEAWNAYQAQKDSETNSYNEVAHTLNGIIAGSNNLDAADVKKKKEEISWLLRLALDEGKISESQRVQLQNTYTPKGYTY